jgi:hypothetical protein
MCPSCNRSASYTTITYNLNGTVNTNQSCQYSKSQLENALAFYSRDRETNSLVLTYLQSAINFYDKDCNRFNSFLDGIQMDL